MKKLGYSVSVILLASVSMVAMPQAAMAQAAAAEDDGGLKDIIITANKREEDLQKAPLSISAISGADAELQGITEIKNIAALAPNVSVLGGTTNATAAVVSIRGIATPADESQGFDSPIGLYLDGVYLARSSAASFEVADIERIEVLRGPQGTLFGRNTTGGAVNFITRDPSKEASFKVKAGYGNYNAYSARGTVDTGLIANDTLRLSGTVLYKSRGGVVDNLLQPKDSLDPGGYKTTSLRFAAMFEPTDRITVRNIMDYTKTTGVPYAQQLAAVGNGLTNPTVFVPGFVNTTPAPVGQFLAQPSTRILEAASGCTRQISTSRIDPICLEGARTATDKVWGNLLRIEVDLGPVLVRSSSAVRKWRNIIRGSDLDGLGTIRGAALGAPSTTLNGFPAAVLGVFQPAGTAAFLASQPVFSANISLFQADNNRRQNQFSQEIELISNSDGGFNWVLGAFYFKETGNEFNNQNFGFILDTNQTVFNATNFGPLAPLLQANNPARYRAALQSIGLGYRASGRSEAVYGQFSYRPGGKDGAFGVTAGIRYSSDHKTFDRFQNGAAPFTNPVEIALNKRKANFDAVTGNVALDYRATDDINLYARVARGYRSGGFNARQPTNVAGNLGLLPFNNEIIWSYEAGVKAEFGRTLRLNASVFYNDYSDLQVSINLPITTGGFATAIANAGKVAYTGFEIEGQFRPSDNFWFDGNVGYSHKNFKEYLTTNSAGAVADISSVFRAGYSPDWTAALAGNAKVALKGDTKATGRVGVTYTSSYFQFGNPIASPFIRETKGDSRALIDAQLRIDGINLGDAIQNVGITFWGKNLNNKKYLSRSVDFGALGFAGTIYGEPRTYGVSLDFGF